MSGPRITGVQKPHIPIVCRRAKEMVLGCNSGRIMVLNYKTFVLDIRGRRKHICDRSEKPIPL